MLFLKTTIVLWYAAEILDGYFAFHHTEYIKGIYIFSGGDRIKLFLLLRQGHA